MGIRPNIYTIFGIDDYDGPMPDEDFYERQMFIPDGDEDTNFTMSWVKDYAFDYGAKEWRWYPDLVYFDSGSGLHNIVGLIKSRDFDSDTFRVLAMLYPEFLESGYKDVPLETPDMQRMHLRGSPVRPCEDIEFQESWFYGMNYHVMTPIWAFVTRWLLNDLGIESDVTKYKWMLVWEWC